MAPNRPTRDGEGRDNRGRFAPGNPGSPGRKPRVTEMEYLDALREELSLDEWRAIVGKAKAQALEGDRSARDFLAKFALPPPALVLDVTTRERDAASKDAHKADHGKSAEVLYSEIRVALAESAEARGDVALAAALRAENEARSTMGNELH